MDQHSQNQKKIIVGIISFVFLIGIILFFANSSFHRAIQQITSSTVATLYYNPIPFIFHTQFHQSLINYVYNATHSRALLILGPSDSGKSRGLLELTKQLQSNSTFVFKLDFETVSPNISPNDLLFSVMRNFIDSISSLDSSKDINLQAALPILERYVRTIISSSHSKLARLPLKKFQNKQLATFSQYYLTIFEHINVSPSLAFRTLIEASEAITPYLKTVFLILSPERIFQCTNEEIASKWSQFWSILLNFIGSNHSLPIITEISDPSIYLSTFNHTSNDYQLTSKIPFEHHFFKILYLDEFNIKETETVLCQQNKIFTKPELALLYDAIGGHGGTFSLAHELATEGYTIGEIIQNIKDQARANIVRSIEKSNNETRATSYLKKVVQNKKGLPISFDEEMSFYFLKNRITTIVNETKVKFGNKRLKAAASELTVIN